MVRQMDMKFCRICGFTLDTHRQNANHLYDEGEDREPLQSHTLEHTCNGDVSKKSQCLRCLDDE